MSYKRLLTLATDAGIITRDTIAPQYTSLVAGSTKYHFVDDCSGAPNTVRITIGDILDDLAEDPLADVCHCLTEPQSSFVTALDEITCEELLWAAETTVPDYRDGDKVGSTIAAVADHPQRSTHPGVRRVIDAHRADLDNAIAASRRHHTSGKTYRDLVTSAARMVCAMVRTSNSETTPGDEDAAKRVASARNLLKAYWADTGLIAHAVATTDDGYEIAGAALRDSDPGWVWLRIPDEAQFMTMLVYTGADAVSSAVTMFEYQLILRCPALIAVAFDIKDKHVVAIDRDGTLSPEDVLTAVEIADSQGSDSAGIAAALHAAHGWQSHLLTA